jgi:cobaltochelatase CobS
MISAMRIGGIFLLDEMNFLKPEVAGGLNTMLQATSYVIPETGELVRAHPDFRIAATGNAMDGVGKSAYRGTQTSNIALLARFTLGIRVRYMTVVDEQKMIEAKSPGIAEVVANYLAEVAGMARKAHEDGALKAPMSPRETIASARRITAYSGNLKGDEALQTQCKSILNSFEMTFLFRWSADDRLEFIKAANSVANRLGIPPILEF